MASISANGSNGHHKFTLTVTENSTSTANNTSSVGFSFVLSPVQTTWNWEQWGANITYTVTVNGTKYTGSIANYDGYSSVTLKSGTLSVAHNSDGNKSISFSFSVSDTSGQSYTCGNASASGSMALSTIPRYLTITNIEITNKTETSIVVKWATSDPRSGTYYSLDNGTTWIGSATDGESLGSDGKSGTFNILKLTANTSYNLKVKIKRSDSSLWTESNNIAFTTYAYPYCTSAPNFTIGNTVKLDFYNPLKRSLEWQVLGADNSVIAGNTTTGATYTGVSGEASVANLYKSIPNAKSGTYKVKVTYGGNVATKTGGTYSIRGDEVPTINAFTYSDNNSTIVAITGNNQHIVQKYSNLVAQVGAATANKGAGGISKYVVECNGKTVQNTVSGNFNIGVIDSNTNVDLKLTVTDTRGLTASKTIKVTMLAHSAPNTVVTLERLNNYEDESYLTVDASISSVNGKNTAVIKYRYKLSGGSYGSFVTIGDKAKQTLSLEKNNVYIFNVVVTDAFGAAYNAEHTLGKGVFPLFIDTEKNSVGVNCFPNNSNSFEVDGLISANSLKCKNLLYTPYTESNKLTITTTKDDHAVITGYYCYLETGKKYTFSCKTDGAWGGGNASDTVEIFMLKDKAYTTYFQILGTPKTFTATATGVYFLRVDVNKNGTTHSFWDFQIEEGGVATDFTVAKHFEHQDRYYIGEHQVGFWFDGKPLYRRVISLGASQFGTTEATAGKNIEIPHNIPNIKDIVKQEGIWRTGDQYRNFPSNFYGNAGWDGHFYCTAANICFELGTAIYNRLISTTTFLYIVLCYTKTTD